MTDPRRLKLDDPVVGALLGSARDYGVPADMRRRVVGALGLSAMAAGGAASAGLASGPLGKTLVALAALVTVGGGAAVYRSSRSQPPAQVLAVPAEPAVRARVEVAGRRDPVPAAASVVAAPSRAGAPAVAVVEPGTTGAGRRAPVVHREPQEKSAAVASVVPAPPPATDRTRGLAAEIALLDEAEASLRRGAFKKALAQVDEHDRRFPNGALAQEAAVLSVAARMGDGDREGAESRAREFLDQHGDGILAARVRSLIAAKAR